jgi:hypothetical protein
VKIPIDKTEFAGIDTLSPSYIEYHFVVELSSGLNIYEYVEPTEEVEIVTRVSVPKYLKHPARAYLARLAADATSEPPHCEGRTFYVGRPR